MDRLKEHINTTRGGPITNTKQTIHTGVAQLLTLEESTSETIDGEQINPHVTKSTNPPQTPVAQTPLAVQIPEISPIYQQSESDSVSVGQPEGRTSTSSTLARFIQDHHNNLLIPATSYDTYNNYNSSQINQWQQQPGQWQQQSGQWQQWPQQQQQYQPLMTNPYTRAPIDITYVNNQFWEIHRSMNHVMNLVSDVYNHMYYHSTTNSQYNQ